MFHEGTKFWSCCPENGKVLEFEEFLKIEPCQKGLHRYIDTSIQQCRHDWYQTQGQVIVSVFAKKTKREETKVTIDSDKLTVHVVFQNGSKGMFETALCQPIIVADSTFTLLTTKVFLKAPRLMIGARILG